MKADLDLCLSGSGDATLGISGQGVECPRVGRQFWRDQSQVADKVHPGRQAGLRSQNQGQENPISRGPLEG